MAHTSNELSRDRTSTSPARRHIPALDGVRGLAILLVMVYHFELRAWPWRSGLGIPFWGLISEGWLGVDLFFVLSGFLITGILLDSKRDRHYFRNFYARRTLRIFPLYYASLAGIFLLMPAISTNPIFTTQNAWWFWTYLGNVLIAVKGWSAAPPLTRHFWSLAVEEQFYLIWPLVVFFASRRQLSRIAVGVIVAALIYRVAFRAVGTMELTGHLLTPGRMDALAVGALLALWMRDAAAAELVKRWARPVLFTTTAAALALVAWRQRGTTDDPVIDTLGLTLFAWAWGAVMAAALSVPRSALVGRFWNAAWLRAMGRYSYGMYIFHYIVSNILTDAGFAPAAYFRATGSLFLAHALYLTVNFGMTLSAAVLSWHFLERPFLVLKDRFSPRPDTARAVDLPALEELPAPN